MQAVFSQLTYAARRPVRKALPLLLRYLVVQMQHAGSDEALWKGKTPAEIPSAMKAGMTLQNLLSRIGDVHFAIDEIARRTKAGEGPFARADADRIGMSGHSFGAQTT